MKKNKLFILLSIITLIFIFGIAATCNLCGTPISIGKTEITQEEIVVSRQIQQTQEEATEPTIKLKISEGPLYSAADDVCYYRIEAQVTGNPTPTISWSKDDSHGAFSNMKAQVNLNRGETYTLTATASNSSGSATDNITLTWGCNGEEVAEGDAEEEDRELLFDSYETLKTDEIELDTGRSGLITSNRNISPGDIYVGDTGAFVCRGLMSFPISYLHEKNIARAELDFSLDESGDPSYFHYLFFLRYYYGTLDEDDWYVWSHGLIFSIAQDDIGDNIIYSEDNLTQMVQQAIDEGYDYFQLGVSLERNTDPKYSDGDSVNDGYIFPFTNQILKVSYF
jgi:hypothetical protein